MTWNEMGKGAGPLLSGTLASGVGWVGGWSGQTPKIFPPKIFSIFSLEKFFVGKFFCWKGQTPTKVCAPEIALQFPASLVNCILPLRKSLMCVGGCGS